jgi:hypothetical protein
MARNSQTALYINDPVKIVAGVFTIRQAIYVAGIVLLTYGLIDATSRLPYGQSGLGQLHILLIVGLPALLTLLVMTFAGSGTVEPYARQFTGYLWRTTLATPRRLAYRMATLARHLGAARHAPALVYGPVLVADGIAAMLPDAGTAPDVGTTPDATASRAVRPLRAPYVAPVVMTTPVARTQRARLLAWLTAHPCVTDEQIAEGTGMNPSAARPRRRELVEAGLVRKVDMDGRTRAGRRAARWVAVGTVGEVVTHGAD